LYIPAVKNPESKYLTIKDYAKLERVSRQTVYNWIKKQKLEKNRDYIILSDGSIAIINK